MHYALLLSSLLLLLAAAATGATQQSKPIHAASVRAPYRRNDTSEIFGFSTSLPGAAVPSYDWEALSTVAWNTDRSVVATAHAHGVRVVAKAADLTKAVLQDASARAAWVAQITREVARRGLDGVNFDFEEPVAPGEPTAVYYTQLVRDTHVGHKSVDIPWSPYDVDGRSYDWAGLAAAADILFVMSYDVQSQMRGRCFASPNSPVDVVEIGLRQWLSLGIDPSKLVLGVPWYGYDYPCVPMANGRPVAPDTDACAIARAPFAGAACSDAAGAQLFDPLRVNPDFAKSSHKAPACPLLRTAINTTAVRRDPTGGPYLNYLNADGTIHQVWFDDVHSLKQKYALAAKYGLRGVGVWHLDALQYDSDDPVVQQQTKGMWEALRNWNKKEAQEKQLQKA